MDRVAAMGLAAVVAILLSVVPAAAQVVVPNAQAFVEGDGNNAFPFSCTVITTSMRYQQVYLASEVATGWITQIAFRQDAASTAFGPTLIPGVSIKLSSTSNAPDTLSTTFATNVGADATTVFSGGLTLSSAASAAVPRPFNITIPLTTPFLFDATAGTNLLLDVTIPTCVTTDQFDSQNPTGDSVSRVSATSSGAAAGTANSFGLVTQFTISPAPSVSPGQIGDALIYALWEVTNLNTLLAIESFTTRTDLHVVRFRDEVGNNVLEFTLCLTPFRTWNALVFRDGSLTRVVSASTLLVNGSATPLNTTLTGNPTRGYIEVNGLRGTTTNTEDTAICTDATLGGDVLNTALMGRITYVNPALSPVLAYGANALALKDTAVTKLSQSATVLGNNGVARALILQGTQTAVGLESTTFGSRYFVAASFGAVTPVVMTFATGPNSGGCPGCRVPASLTFVPTAEDGPSLASFARPTGGKLVNVFNLTSADIASTGGVVRIAETPASVSIPTTGFVVQTTSSPPLGQPFFNVLFPLSAK